MDDAAIKQQIANFRSAIRKWPTLMLDNLGIQVDVTSAYNRTAALAGKSIDDLTEQERIAAILDAYVSKRDV
jgi:hypothetical protein